MPEIVLSEVPEFIYSRDCEISLFNNCGITVDLEHCVEKVTVESDDPEIMVISDQLGLTYKECYTGKTGLVGVFVEVIYDGQKFSHDYLVAVTDNPFDLKIIA